MSFPFSSQSSRILGLLFVAAAVFICSAISDAREEFSPEQYYVRSIQTMRAIHDPQFLSFQYEFDQVLGEQHQHAMSTIVFRTSDGLAHETDASGKVIDTLFPIRPDLFIGDWMSRSAATSHGQETSVLTVDNGAVSAPGAAGSDGKDMTVIGRVTTIAVHYDITRAASDPVPNCPDPVHLRLVPRSEPLRYNIREMWIDANTSRVCRAVLSWNIGHVGKRIFPIDVTVLLNADGFVTSWEATGAVHSGILSANYDSRGIYTGIQQAASMPDK